MAIIDKVSVGGSTYDIQDARGESLALVDGYYEQMTVGNSEQLVSTVGVEDKVPYNFRTSGGSADIGDREVDKIVGGTVAWNQIAPAGTTGWSTQLVDVTYENGEYTLVPNVNTSGAKRLYITIPKDHVYYFSGDIVSDGTTIAQVGLWKAVSSGGIKALQNTTTTYSHEASVSKPTESAYFGIRVENAATTSQYMKAKNLQCFDLTQMFGSTIADYINTLETATPGAGVNLFRSLFPAPYYAYNSGELMSVKATAHNMVGFNAFDKSTSSEWLNAYIGSGGVLLANASTKSAIIPCVPEKKYFAFKTKGARLSLASFAKYPELNDVPTTYATDLTSAQQVSITTGANDHYLVVWFFNSNVDTGLTAQQMADTLCVNLSWDGERDGEYEPYSLHSYPLDDVELRGIPKLDADNRLYYDGDTYEDDGTVTRRYAVVDLSAITFNAASPYKTASLPGVKPTQNDSTVANVISTKYHTTYRNGTNNTGDLAINSVGHLYIRTDEEPSGYLVYELETPTTESADPYQNPQIVNDFGTEEYVDSRTVAIPVGHETTYQANLRAKLEMAPNSPSGDGDYIVRQTNGQNVYVPITFPADELPSAPSDNGTYHLSVTVANGTATYSWESDS